MDMLTRRRMLLACTSNPVFFITYSGTTYEYEFEKNMTWSEFVASDYNDGNFSISGTEVFFKSDGEVSSATSSSAITEDKTYTTVIVLYVYQAGDTAWQNTSEVYNSNSDKIKVTFNTDHVQVGGYMGFIGLKVDFTNYSKLIITGYTGYSRAAQVGYSTSKYTGPTEEIDLTTSTADVVFNISSLTGSYYIIIYTNNTYSYAKITEIKLVK